MPHGVTGNKYLVSIKSPKCFLFSVEGVWQVLATVVVEVQFAEGSKRQPFFCKGN